MTLEQSKGKPVMNAKLFAVTAAFLALFAFSDGSTSRAQNLFVTAGISTVAEFDSSGTYFGDFVNGGLFEPSGLVFDSSGNLYVANLSGCSSCGLGSGYLEEFDSSGDFVSIIRSAAGLNRPAGLAFGSNRNLYVANNGGNNIEVFNSSGVGTTFASTNLSEPVGLAFDSAGNLFVANLSGNGMGNIMEFNSSGVGRVFANSGLNSPQGLAFDSAGNLYVADSGNNTVEKFNSSGVGTVFANSGLDSPWGLAFGTNGNLYVANTGDSTIAEFDPSGSEVSVWGLNQPVDLAFDTIPEPASLLLAAVGALLLWPLLKRNRA
jgi:DNA-binding beta-propeller fold protein YncE